MKASQIGAGAIANTYFHGKTETQVKEAIMSYTTLNGLTREKLADIAVTTHGDQGNFEFATRVRSDDSLGANPICFNAVRLWLFKAGFVSLKWLASEGYGLNANIFVIKYLGTVISLLQNSFLECRKGICLISMQENLLQHVIGVSL
ncbi:MAG: hypothetical protein JST20_08640 [Bacteroidetes bacterium]|nr:hypothetical protein [Bacteroidota bacterium]